MYISRTTRRSSAILAILVAVAMLATLLPSFEGRSADHLDAPGTMPPSGNIQADINDLYVFQGEDSDSTVLALTVVPAALGDSSFGADVLYEIKVDVDGDAVEDHSFEFTFSDVRDNGAQFVIAQHAEDEAAANGSADGALAGYGQVGKELELNNGGMLYTGLRSDPFFFDLAGFLGTVSGMDNGRDLNDGNESDFFEPLDTLAIVLEIPDSAIDLAEGTFGAELGVFAEGTIGVWATTSGADGTQIDRIGRPAINTAVNDSGPLVNAPTENKNVYNAAEPVDDRDNFTAAAASALTAYSELDPVEGAYTECQLGVLALVFLPDILPFSKTSELPSPVEGRALEDDVIDVSLRVVTGGDPLGLFGPDGLFCTDGPDRDADGAINTDGVGPHDDYLDAFPYLGEPHAAVTLPELSGDNFIANLRGVNEVPAVDTQAAGVSAFALEGTGAIEHLNLAYNLEAVSAGHIHVGDPGKNGPVVTFLYQSDGENIDGMISAGLVGDDDLVAGDIEDLIDVMQGGFAYANFHTTDFPGGEIRGQVQALVASDVFTDDDGNVHEANIDVIAAAQITLGCNPPDNSEYCPEREITRGEMAAFMARAFNLPEGPDAFTDDGDSIFEGDINAIADVGITLGCNPPTNDQFCPERDMTRGEMAAFVVRAWELPASEVDAFTDDEGSVFEADINALAAAGVTVGCNPPTNDQFCPDRNMSRGEMASFIARAFGWES